MQCVSISQSVGAGVSGHSASSVRLAAFDWLIAAAALAPDVAVRLLPLCVYCLNTELDPTVVNQICHSMPLLATHEAAVAPTVAVMSQYAATSGQLYGAATRWYYALWTTQAKTFGQLRRMLQQGGEL